MTESGTKTNNTQKIGLKQYQMTVIVIGIALWLASAASLAFNHTLRQQLTVFALAVVTVFIGMFPHSFRLPVGLKFTHEKITFTLTDAIVLLIAVWHGLFAAVFVAAIEGFTSSRRSGSKLSSHLFSSSMMSLGAAASAAVLSAVLRYGFGESGNGSNHTFAAVAVALFAASIVQFAINAILLSTLLALRHNVSIIQNWKHFVWAAPMFLPTSTAASFMYLALQYAVLIVIAIAIPMLLTIYFAHRQYRDSVEKRIAVMDKAHRETIEALAVAINAKDEVTHEHVMRVQIYAAGVARILGCSDAEVEALKAGALLHDIGKIAVPDYILNKPGKLTAAEFEKMKYHTIAGARILGRVEFPYPVVPVVRHHHERWDGKGYPDGLSGEEIPLTARILSVVDCFDAVREDRQYRKAMTREEAIELIMRGSGSQYDPHVVVTFISQLPEFEAEIQSHRGDPVPTFGIEPTEKLSETALLVPPAAGLAEDEEEEAAQETIAHDETKALCDLAQALIAARSQEEIFSAFTQKLARVAPFDLCGITMVMPGTGEIVVAHAAGQHKEWLKGRYVGLGEGVTGWAIANRKTFCNVDPRLDLPLSLSDELSDYRTLAVFPLIKDRQIYGGVSLYSSALDEYTPEHQRLIGEAAAMMATALSTVSQFAMLQMEPDTVDDDRALYGVLDSKTLN